MTDTFKELDHPARLLMGPGPINVHPRVLRAMSVQLSTAADWITSHQTLAPSMLR